MALTPNPPVPPCQTLRSGEQGWTGASHRIPPFPGLRPRLPHATCHPFLYPIHFLPQFLGCRKGPFYDYHLGEEFSKGCIPRDDQKILIVYVQSPLTSRRDSVKGTCPHPGPIISLPFTHLCRSLSSPKDRRKREA